MSDTTTETKEPEFTLAHRDRMAVEAAELLQRQVEDIGRVRGRAGVGPEELKFEAASDAEMRGYIAGVREMFTTLHDWIEHRFAGDSDTSEAHQACVHRGVSYNQINAELDGAAGELAMRRHPNGATPFPGRFRKLNAWLILIRTMRCAVNVELPAGDRETFNQRYDAWRDQREEAAREWLTGPTRGELSIELSPSTFKAKSSEEFEARGRVERELQALDAVCHRLREDRFQRELKKFDRTMESLRGDRKAVAA